MNTFRRRLFVVGVLSSIFLVGSVRITSLRAEELIRTVALSGEHAVGTPAGSDWQSFGQPVLAVLTPPFNGPVLNDLGQVAFSGALQIGGGGVTTDTNGGVWTEAATGNLKLLARKGDVPVGGNPGELYYDFYRL
ncbi:MAG TPA: choice-of-anchor tandem repeat NxxGxxAF-containing protein, partial [Pirellulaceae bacterium]